MVRTPSFYCRGLWLNLCGANKTFTSHSVCVLSHFSHVLLFVTLWTLACQASLSLRFSRQEYWSGLPCPPPRDRPDPGTEPTSLTSPALAGRFFNTRATWEPPSHQLSTLPPRKNTKRSKGVRHRDLAYSHGLGCLGESY